MRKPFALLLVVVAAAALVAAGPADTSKWEVTAETIEGCSCPLFCTCYFGASTPAHMCQANNVYKFKKGSHYGGVDLSDQLLWMTLDLGGEWHHKPGPGMPGGWLVLTFDKSSTPEQRKALEAVANSVFPVKWGKYETRVDSISWHDEAMKSHAKLASGMGEIMLDKSSTLRPDKQKPVVVENLQYWFTTGNEGFVLAHSTHNWSGDTKFSHEKRNGFNITWTAKGDVKPATKAAMP
jgi:hypothetical protein